MVLIFKTKEMYDIPDFGDYFRVGGYVGRCVFKGFGRVIMFN